MLSTDVLYILFVTTGFTVGFGHCIGMCGPIVVSLSLNLKGKNTFLPQIYYNTGRIATYAVLGGLMGITGSFTLVTSRLIGLQKGAMIVAGALIIIMGLLMGGWISMEKLFKENFNSQGFISRAFRKLTEKKTTKAYFPMGLLLGLLPCGPVYTVLIASARAGMDAETPITGLFHGMGLMVAFGLGTVPALLIVGKLADLGWLKSRRIIYKLSAIIMIVVGGYFVVKGIQY